MSEQTKRPQLFTELFRPKTLDQAIIVPRIYNELKNGATQNFLFYGTQGAGKTTLTRILAQGHEVLEINGSLDRGIDTVRTDIQNFVSSNALFGESNTHKVVQIEESENLSNDAWLSLRALIEKYHDNVRFIANCNYIDKIPEPIQSRFNCIPIDPINAEEEQYLFKGYEDRVKQILSYLKIGYTDDGVHKFVKLNFPDMRSIIKKIQQMVTRGDKELTADMIGATFDGAEIFKIIMETPNPWENYKKLVADWSTRPEEAMLKISEEFPKYLNTVAPDKIGKLPWIIIEIADHIAKLNGAIDKFIILESLVFKIQGLIHS